MDTNPFHGLSLHAGCARSSAASRGKRFGACSTTDGRRTTITGPSLSISTRPPAGGWNEKADWRRAAAHPARSALCLAGWRRGRRNRGASLSQAQKSLSMPDGRSLGGQCRVGTRSPGDDGMTRNVIVGAEYYAVICPRCQHRFPLEQGISGQTIDRYAQDFEPPEAGRRVHAACGERVRAAGCRTESTACRNPTTRPREARAQIEKVREDAARAAREAQQTEMKSLQEANKAKDEALAKARGGELALRRSCARPRMRRRTPSSNTNASSMASASRSPRRPRSATIYAERRDAQRKAQLESARREAADLKRKLEQGSQQLQGEALELALGAVLREAFPLDQIEAVTKGVRGRTCCSACARSRGRHAARSSGRRSRRKPGPAWVQKLKDDQRAIGAEFAVIVSAAMPRDCERAVLAPGRRLDHPLLRRARWRRRCAPR